MSFLSATLLGALLPLLTLPLVIHLLNKGFPKRFRFPSIELIKETMARRSRLHRWRHLILWFLRTAFLLLLLLAFLRPVLRRFGMDPAAPGARRVLIVVDHSLSMEYRGDGPSARQRAIHEADRLVESLGPQDAVNLVLLQERPSSCFVEFSTDHAAVQRYLATLGPGLGRGDVHQANALVARLVAAADRRPEVYYLSDFQRRNWAATDFGVLPSETRLFFVDCGATRRDNRAVLDVRLDETRLLAGDTATLEITVGNFTDQPFNERITVELDQQHSVDTQAAIAPWSEGRCRVPVPLGTPGRHRCEVRLAPDGLRADDHFFGVITVQEKEEVLIVSDAEEASSSAAFFLRMALNPFENEAGSLWPRRITSTELTSGRLAGVPKVFLTKIHSLTPEASQALAQYLFAGGGVVYFLDGEADPGNVNALDAALGLGTMPLRLTEKRSARNVTTGAQQFVRGNFKSRYLRLFRGARRQDLGLLEFYDYYQAGATQPEGILLSYTDESPALAVVHHGLGTMLLLNFSADERSSNLARQRVFPAWMQDLVKAVSTDEPPPIASQVGETLQAEVWRHELREQQVLDPAGRPVRVERERLGERVNVSFTPEQLGFYTLGSPRPQYIFGVNPSPDEADLRPLDKAVLPTDFAATHDAHFVGGREDYEELAQGRPVFHWFVVAGLVVLLLETGFQWWLRRSAA